MGRTSYVSYEKSYDRFFSGSLWQRRHLSSCELFRMYLSQWRALRAWCWLSFWIVFPFLLLFSWYLYFCSFHFHGNCPIDGWALNLKSTAVIFIRENLIKKACQLLRYRKRGSSKYGRCQGERSRFVKDTVKLTLGVSATQIGTIKTSKQHWGKITPLYLKIGSRIKCTKKFNIKEKCTVIV